MTNMIIYLVGTLLVVAGLAYGASRLGVSQVWIVAGGGFGRIRTVAVRGPIRLDGARPDILGNRRNGNNGTEGADRDVQDRELHGEEGETEADKHFLPAA